jgi:hypothetical protein
MIEGKGRNMSATVIINGKVYNGKSSVAVVGDSVVIDGVRQDNNSSADGSIKIEITEGTLENLSCDRSVDVSGNVHSVKAQGSVSCRNITGGVDAGGSVNCSDVVGKIRAGGSVNCKNFTM